MAHAGAEARRGRLPRLVVGACASILATIGNTPLVRLRALAPANGAELWVKLEYLNPTGLDEGSDGALDDRGRRAGRA